jgi:hypothetical protein
VAVDSLESPLGILELHLLLVALERNLLLPFPLAVRRAVTARLLRLLLAELLHEFLDLPTLLRAVAHRVVYRAPRTTLIAAGGMSQPLVTSWAMTPTGHSNSSDSGNSGQRLVVAASLLLLPISISATALSSGICFGPAGLPCLWCRL